MSWLLSNFKIGMYNHVPYTAHTVMIELLIPKLKLCIGKYTIERRFPDNTYALRYVGPLYLKEVQNIFTLSFEL